MAGENQITGVMSTVEEVIENERNGFLIKVDNPVESRVVMGKILAGDLADPDVSDFAQLLIDTRLLDSRYKDPITKENIPILKFLAASNYWTAFIPTNAAMAEARAAGLVPTASDSLNNFLMYHFVKNKVIFDDGLNSGNFDTNQTYKDETGTTVNAILKVVNTPGNLSIEDISGQVVNIDHADANILVRKGVVHKINSVLKYYQ
jgi:uncharacterized surface protein with fasciclin (FAS1) repeats